MTSRRRRRGPPGHPPHLARGRAEGEQVIDDLLGRALALTAQTGVSFGEARRDPAFWGRLVESAVGAHLANAAAAGICQLHYWRHRGAEVDFVLTAGGKVTAIEVKSGASGGSPAGRDAFQAQFEPDRMLVVGGDGVPLESFLADAVGRWVA